MNPLEPLQRIDHKRDKDDLGSILHKSTLALNAGLGVQLEHHAFQKLLYILELNQEDPYFDVPLSMCLLLGPMPVPCNETAPPGMRLT